MNTAALDVTIGLVMMYLLLSLLCTIINELAANLLRLRAKTLQEALGKIIDVATLKQDFYNHGIIDTGNSVCGDTHMSYMPGQHFASAIMGSLTPAATGSSFEEIKASIQRLPDSNIRDTLLSHVAIAGGDIERLHAGLASWFEHSMQRVSGVYRRMMKYLSLACGITLAVALNADTITVSKALWNDAGLRSQLTGYTDKILSQNALSPQEIVRNTEEQLRPLPLGWNTPAPHYGLLAIISKLAGLAMTGLAISLGAPFWFDILSKCVRGTGNKPD